MVGSGLVGGGLWAVGERCGRCGRCPTASLHSLPSFCPMDNAAFASPVYTCHKHTFGGGRHRAGIGGGRCCWHRRRAPPLLASAGAGGEREGSRGAAAAAAAVLCKIGEAAGRTREQSRRALSAEQRRAAAGRKGVEGCGGVWRGVERRGAAWSGVWSGVERRGGVWSGAERRAEEAAASTSNATRMRAPTNCGCVIRLRPALPSMLATLIVARTCEEEALRLD